MNVNCIYYDHFVVDTNIKSLCGTHETNICQLHLNNKNNKQKNLVCISEYTPEGHL